MGRTITRLLVRCNNIEPATLLSLARIPGVEGPLTVNAVVHIELPACNEEKYGETVFYSSQGAVHVYLSRGLDDVLRQCTPQDISIAAAAAEMHRQLVAARQLEARSAALPA